MFRPGPPPTSEVPVFQLRSVLVLSLLVAAAAPANAQDKMPADSLAYARKLTTWFFGGQLDSLHARLDAEGRANMDLAEMQNHLDEITARAGAEIEVVEEKFVKRNGNTQYWRTAKFSEFTSEPLMLRWAFNPKGEIVGIGFNPLSQAPPIDP